MDQDSLDPQAGQNNGASNADVCSYSLYLPGTRDTSELQALCASILTYASTLCVDSASGKPYIWQRQSFNLTISEDAKNCLTGQTSFGESVEDEWFIVYLLREISKKYTELVVKIEDNDGQFLLIEAAEVLPNWLNPDNAENRLWIASGNLHLIPLSHTSPPPPSSTVEPGYLAQNDALSLVTNPNIDTLASEDISSAIWSRTAHLPDGIKDQWHTTVAQLPVEVITLLHKDEGLISRAVQAFYERDALQLKACQYMKRFPPSPSKLSNVRMTKALYAQLVSQRFYAPKIFEKSGWQTNSNTDDAQGAQTSESSSSSKSKTDARRAEIGMKISCGFEILYSESSSKRRRGTKVKLQRNNDLQNQQHLSQDKAYLKYIVSLTKAGYFQGEIAGSSLYTKLEGKANEYWLEMGENGESKENMADRIDQLLSMPAAEGMDEQAELKEDDDSWLYIDEARLEEMLKARQRPTNVAEDVDSEMPEASSSKNARAADDEESEDEDEKMANEQARKLQDMASKFEGFVEGKGSLEGAMFEDELSDDDDDDEDEEDDGLGDDLGDIVAGGKRLSEAEKNKKMDRLVPGLKEEEWGAEAAEREKAETARLKEAKRASAVDADGESKDVEMAEDDTDKLDMKEEEDTMASKATVASARLSSLDKMDGVSDSSDSEDDGLGTKAEDPFMGAPASGVSRQALVELDNDDDDLDEDEAPQIVEDDEEDIQFGEGEMEEFLKFTRDALGLTEEQYDNIVETRKKNGSFVPGFGSGDKIAPAPATKTDSPRPTKPLPRQSPAQPKGSPATVKRQPPASAGDRNAKLDSFEALMDAMDSELQRSKSGSTPSAPASFSKSSKPVRKSAEGVVIDDIESDDEEEDDAEGDMASLDAELAAALKGGNEMGGEGMDYTMIKNFLESFKSQNGLAGPVSNMFGRLDKDFKMPRDE